MTSERTPLFFSFSLFFLAACGSSQPPAPDGRPDEAAVTPAKPETPREPKAPGSAEPAAPPDTGSFAAAPTVEVSGASLRLTYQGGLYTMTEAAIVPKGKTFELRFRQPAEEGAHEIRFTPSAAKPGEAAKLEGKGALFFQLTDGKNTDGNYKLVDISKSCNASGTVTFAEIPKGGTSGGGTLDVTITCEGVEAFREPLVIKGDFSSVPLKKK
jgi:hypothetical protein